MNTWNYLNEQNWNSLFSPILHHPNLCFSNNIFSLGVLFDKWEATLLSSWVTLSWQWLSWQASLAESFPVEALSPLMVDVELGRVWKGSEFNSGTQQRRLCLQVKGKRRVGKLLEQALPFAEDSIHLHSYIWRTRDGKNLHSAKSLIWSCHVTTEEKLGREMIF